MLNSVEHEILYAHKYKNIKKFGLFKAQLSLECYFSRSCILTYISGENFMLNRVEHEKSFITSGPGVIVRFQDGMHAFSKQKL